MAIIVTGGAGFLGAHLIESLLENGQEVLAVDVFWTGRRTSLERFEKHPSFSVLEHDVRTPFPADISASQIYHLACPASPRHFATDPLNILDTCYLGTRNVLELARKCAATVLLASTSEVYGDPQIWPQSEEYWGNVNCFGPRACYDEGKRVAEAMVYAYRQQFNLNVKIARIFNVYGPGMLPDDGRVVSNFISSAIKGEDIRLYGKGDASRCFQYATDCISGFKLLMNSDWNNGPVNIGAETEVTVKELAEMVLSKVKAHVQSTKSVIVTTPSVQDDPMKRKPDCARARQVLGWEPTIDISAGLDKTILWHLTLVGRLDS